ncbi:SMI1/KNR4 family protein [Amycolatopsis sp. NPDC049688]|uniref:SMI1/KNR4 family protein n=1 Tax=Amycolatopsis sp. NPDC049688 TaxID=3154733 RepID=UPI0034377456
MREEYVAALEQALGRALPPALRAMLLRQNGGRLGEWRLHPVRDPSDRRTLKRTAEDIAHLTRLARRQPGFPGDAVSIAHDYSMADQLVLLPDPVSGRLSDQVFRWDRTAGVRPFAASIDEVGKPKRRRAGPGRPSADAGVDGIVAHYAAKCVVERSDAVHPVFGTDVVRVELSGEELCFTEDAFGVDLTGLAPDGLPIATDGFGNHWVVDVRDGRAAEVLFIAHDPPVVLLQARSLGDFLVLWFETGLDPDEGGPLDAVHEAANAIWRRPPDRWDARTAEPGTGIPWAGPHAAVRQGTVPLWERGSRGSDTGA